MRKTSRPRLLSPVRALVAVLTFAGMGLAAVLSPAPAYAAPLQPASASVASPEFTDLHGDEPYAAPAAALAKRAVMLRHYDGSLDPDGTVTRAEMAYFLAKAMRLPDSSTQAFSDVAPHDWFSRSVGALVDRKLVQGTGSGTFSPGRTVSRQEAARLVMKAVAFAHKRNAGTTALLEPTREEALTWLGGFRDRLLIDTYSTVAVAAAYRFGILDCPADGWFIPAGNLTRAEMVMMLYRAFLQPLAVRTAYPLVLPAVPEYSALSAGAEGPLVSFLQTRLTALHYPCGGVDAVYDHQTSDAVMAFQKVEQLPRTGRMTAEVWARLLTAAVPEPALSAPGTRCEVDLGRQVLFMISDNTVTKIVHVSTGKLGTRTGHFSIGAKYEGWVDCVTLDGKMYYPSYVVSRTAIHGFESVPPYPASHGCVRVPVWTAEGLYRQLPTGTVVDIYH